MILGFKQYFPWKGEDGKPEPTYFKEKITERFFENQPNPIVFVPKIHTFREDPHNRWKAGMKVSMVYRGAGYKIIDHFNEGIPELGTIKSIQKISIWYSTGLPNDESKVRVRRINCMIDGIWFSDVEQTEKIARNDGFDSLDQFKKWFKTDWEGKIIHFTDFRYE